jgi:hypothetical protein
VDSLEQRDQVRDYLEHLRYCTNRNRKERVLIYLTPNGRRPDSLGRVQFDEAKASGSLHCWSYQVELRQWLENCRCRRDCKAQKIFHFISDFISYIESDLKREPETNDEEETNEN